MRFIETFKLADVLIQILEMFSLSRISTTVGFLVNEVDSYVVFPNENKSRFESKHVIPISEFSKTFCLLIRTISRNQDHNFSESGNYNASR